MNDKNAKPGLDLDLPLRCCGRCHFSEVVVNPQQIGKRLAQCRLAPPQLVSIVGLDPKNRIVTNVNAMFPMLEVQDWCHQFMPRGAEGQPS